MQILNTGEYSGEIIQKKRIDNVIITNTLYSTKKSNPEWHYHENLHICFVFQGGRAETRHSTKYTQKDGSIFFYHSEERHRWISPQAISKSANIEVELDFLKKYNFTETTIKEAIQKGVDSKTLILKMQGEMRTNEAANSLSIQTLLLDLLSKQEVTSSRAIPKWVPVLSELLQDNWNEELTLPAIAKIVGVHPVTISKHFRKYFSCTLGEYRRKIKIERSLDLIKNSTLSLSEIAFHCGFSDQSHFIRNFKENTGFLPKAFRKF